MDIKEILVKVITNYSREVWEDMAFTEIPIPSPTEFLANAILEKFNLSLKEGEKKFPFTGDFGFDVFWSAYPKKKAKPIALKAWKKLKVDEPLLQKIMFALADHKKDYQWLKSGGQFIPMPSTWLNQRRWEDELKVDNGNSKFEGL